MAVLNTGFRIVSSGQPALGSAPLSRPLPNVVSHDASAYFDVLVHNSYEDVFDQMASNVMAGRDPPPARDWLKSQRLQVHNSLAHALGRLPRTPAVHDAVSVQLNSFNDWLQHRLPRWQRLKRPR